eukprot:jgi/Ulvmu1/10955/UM007_0134.1
MSQIELIGSMSEFKGGIYDDEVRDRSIRRRASMCRNCKPAIVQGSHLAFAHVPGISDRLRSSILLWNDEKRHTVAGTLARTTAQCIVHPLDTIKTRLQVSRPNNVQLVQWKAAATHRRTVISLPGLHLRCRNLIPFGTRDVYRGLGASFLGTIPVALIYFAAYERTKAHLETKKWSNWTKHLAAGAVGAVTSACVRVPTDTIRHRVQAYLHPTVIHAVPALARSKGIGGFYSGFLPTIIRDVPEIALQFGMYEALRAAVTWHAARHGGGDGGKLPTWQHLILGGAAGAFATSVTMPIDVIKTHLQCGGKEARQAGPWRTFAQLCAHDRRGLWAGMGPRMAQNVLMSAIFFTLFEFWKAQLKPASQREGTDRLLSKKLYEKPRDHIWKRQFSFR